MSQINILNSNLSEPQNQTTPTRISIKEAPTFEEKGKAIGERMSQIHANPKFQALSPEKQDAVRMDFYKKHVEPAYKGFHVPVPNAEDWVKAHHSALGDVGFGVDKALNNIEMFGLKTGSKLLNETYKLTSYFTKNPETQAGATQQHNNAQQVLSHAMDAAHARLQSDDFWLDTHPRETVLGRLSSTSGEFIAQLPLFEALGAEAIGAKVLPSLTARLATNTTGKWVTKRLLESTSGFLINLGMSGGDLKSGEKGAVLFGALGAGGSAVGAGGRKLAESETGQKVIQKVASLPLIKKWTANILAVGGRHLANELAESAHNEVIAEVADTAKEEARKITDPLLHTLHEGEKVSQGSIAMQMFGKPLRNLSKNQRALVLARRQETIAEAAKEATALLPDLSKAEAENEVQNFNEKVATENPALAAKLKALDGIIGKSTTSSAVAENDITTIAKETGISNAPKAATKVVMATKSAAKDNITPKKFASLNAETLAYFRAPQNRKKFTDAIGEAAKGNWDAFYAELKAADQSTLTYERPDHRLLMLYAQREKLPANIATTIVRRLKQLEEYKNNTPSQIYQRARYMQNHAYDMSRRGELAIGSNIYASTKTTGPASFTKWQRILTREADQRTIKDAQRALKNHPNALAGFNSVVKQLQKQAFQAQSPEEYKAYVNALEQSVKSIKGFVAGEDIVLFDDK